MAGTILTNIGLSKLATATPQNQLNITNIAVGDGNGGFPTLSPSMTALTNEVWRGDSSNPVKDSTGTNYVYFETNIPPEVGPFDVREIACFDSDGDMIAIGHTALIQKPNPTDDASFAVAVKIFIAIENASDFDLIYQNLEVTSHNSLVNRNQEGAHLSSSILNQDSTTSQETYDLVKGFDTVSAAVNYSKIDKILGSRVWIEERGTYFYIVLSSSFSGDGEGMDELTSNFDTDYGFKLGLIAGTNNIDPYWLGAKGVSGFDNADQIERAASIISSGLLSFGVNGRYELSRTAYLSIGVSIDGYTGNRSFSGNFDDTVQFASQLGGVYVENFLFFLNIDPNGNTETWVTEFPNNGSGTIKNLSIDGTDTDGINGFKFAGSYEFKELDGVKVGSIIRKPNVYTDKLKIYSIHGRLRSDDVSYFVDLPGLGDGYEISSIAGGYIGDEDIVAKGIYVGITRGVDISSLINGDHLIERTEAFDLHSCHQEGGDIIIRDSSGVVRDNAFYREKEIDSRVILESVSPADRFTVTMERNVFTSSLNRRGGWRETDSPDIVLHPSFSVNLRDNVRRWTDSTKVVEQGRTAALIGSDENTFIQEFINYAHLLTDCTVINNQVQINLNSVDLDKTFNGLGTPVSKAVSGATWSKPSDTYYYKADLVIDPVRNIGRKSELQEVSISKVNGGDLTSISIVWGNTVNRGNLILRVYRGVSSGIYSDFVDLHIISLQTLIDSGDAVNGVPWGALASESTYSLGLTSAINVVGGVIQAGTYGGLPTEGTWKQGDIVKKVNTAIDENNMVTDSYRRLTNGSSHVNNVDWAIMRSSTVSPAI
jgi:hypothetical protein